MRIVDGTAAAAVGLVAGIGNSVGIAPISVRDLARTGPFHLLHRGLPASVAPSALCIVAGTPAVAGQAASGTGSAAGIAQTAGEGLH